MADLVVGIVPTGADNAIGKRTLAKILPIRSPFLSIPLLVSRETGPALCWSRAGHRLVVPESLWAGLSTSERSAILRHELEHYRRGDLWTALVVRGLAILHWFHPMDVKFSPDGTKLLTGFQGGSVIVWDVHRMQAASKK
jgi:hypothetical protein